MSPGRGRAGRLATLLLVLALPTAPALAEEPALQPRIANGVPSTAWPEVGLLLTPTGTCTATLIGCRTALTAAHCACDPAAGGAPCGDGEFAERPEDLLLFVPQAGFLGVEQVRAAPGYEFGVAGDAALLELLAPVRSVRPRAVNEAGRPPFGTAATIVGFGVTQEGAADSGLKRAGAVTTGSCAAAGVPGASHVCWTFAAPVGAPGTDSNICSGDSGGPLLADLGAGTTLVGVHSGGSLDGCDVTPSPAFATDVFVVSDWIRSEAGVDLDEAACSDGPQVGDAEVTTLAFARTANAGQLFHDFTIPAGTKRLRVALDGEADPAADLDLYVGLGARPTTSDYACASVYAGSVEACELADPPAGSGHLLVRRTGSAVDYQAIVTLLPPDPPPPPLPAGGLVVAGFRSGDLLQVDPATGRRAIASSPLRGGGPALAGPEGLALDVGGDLLVANAFDRSLLRVARDSGDRTLVSGCEDAGCTATRGAGPAFLGPRFVARAPGGALLVADRSEPGIWALVAVDPASGDRTVLSGCADASCSAVVGSGPAIGRLFGLAVEAAGTVVVADGRAVSRIDPATGDRALLSGCPDEACSAPIGAGPVFGEPVDLLVEPAGTLLVGYRLEGSAFGAIRRVDPATGARTLVSGCEDTGCAALRGAGPAFADLFGLALDARGALHASDATLDAVLRVDLASGDRTLVSGCGDGDCQTAAGSGPRFGEAVDLLAVPAPSRGLGAAAALAALAAVARRRARAGVERPTSRRPTRTG